jgi:hypothetical protein
MVKFLLRAFAEATRLGCRRCGLLPAHVRATRPSVLIRAGECRDRAACDRRVKALA